MPPILSIDRVGLDLGRNAIKAVRYSRSLWGREELTHFSLPLPADVRSGSLQPASRREAVLSALTTFVATHRLQEASVTTALPCHELFVRSVSLPFRNAKKQAQVVPFEIESQIPLGLEDVVIDSIDLPPPLSSSVPTNSSDVLVAAVPRQILTDHLQLCIEAGLTSPSVTLDALALFCSLRFLDRSGVSVPGECMVIDVGASKTTLCLTFQGRPWVLRNLLWGTEHLTDTLAARQSCTRQDAQALFRTMTAAQLEPCLAPLVKEIQLTLHAYEATTQTRIWQCYVCGGGAHLKDIGALFSTQLELEPVPVGRGLEALTAPEFAVALGLAVGGPRRRAPFQRGESPPSFTFDFRNAALSSKKTELPSGRDMWLAGLGLLLLCLLAGADLWTRMTLKDQQLRALRSTLQTRFAQHFSGPASPGEELDQARSRITATRKLLDQIETDRSAVLAPLAELVRRLPKEIPLKIGSLLIEHSTIQLEADTDSFDSVERIKQALAASTSFKSVVMNDVRVGTSANQVRFRAGLEVTP